MEDVKAFLQFVVVMIVGTMTFGVIFTSRQLTLKVLKMLTDARENSLDSEKVFVNTFSFGPVIILSLYEFFFYLMFHRCLGTIASHCIFALGVVLLISTTVSLLVKETIVRHNYLASTNNNTPIPCMGHGTLSASMGFRWMAVPLFLHSLTINKCF